MTGDDRGARRLKIAVVGTGIGGMSAAWLLSRRHDVTVYEAAGRLGGHTNTVDAPAWGGGHVPVDTGFIVYNEKNYPNLVALFAHLGVETRGSDMSFAVSLDDGGLEYGSTSLKAVFRPEAQPPAPAVLVDAAGPAAILQDRAAHGGPSGPIHHAGRLSGPARLWRRLPERPPPAPGVRHLVIRHPHHPRLSGLQLRALLRKPRPFGDRHRRPAPVADGGRRQPRLYSAPDRPLRRSHPPERRGARHRAQRRRGDPARRLRRRRALRRGGDRRPCA